MKCEMERYFSAKLRFSLGVCLLLGEWRARKKN